MPNQPNSSSGRSLQETASVVGTRLAEAAAHLPATRSGLKEGWDAIVKIAFAPCAGDVVGGVPRADALAGASPARTKGSRDNTLPSWGASVPLEVSASQDREARSLLAQASTVGNEREVRLPTPEARQKPQGIPEQRALTPTEKIKLRQRAKLRQLGARHQLANGFVGESLADTARPSAEDAAAAAPASPELVDFDDGISAISSHTLEEMEQRRQARERRNVVRLHPLDFTQIIDEDAAVEFGNPGGNAVKVEKETDNKDTEVVFGTPFFQQDEALFQNVTTVVDETKGVAYDAFTPSIPPPPPPASALIRATSSKSRNTTITEESHEMEEMMKRHEAMYWVDDGRVARTEETAKDRRARPGRGMSIEERARRLRELSRSRSRSDGTGSTNKSGTSSLLSGQHPHDTVPVYPSDLFARRKKSSSKSARRSKENSGLVPGSVTGESDPFSALDYGEI